MINSNNENIGVKPWLPFLVLQRKHADCTYG